MTNLRKAAEMALESWEFFFSQAHLEIVGLMYGLDWAKIAKDRTETLRQALAQPEQTPVAYVSDDGASAAIVLGIDLDKLTPLYTAPLKSKWVGLTDVEVESWRGNYDFFDSALVREVEAKLKEKNS